MSGIKRTAILLSAFLCVFVRFANLQANAADEKPIDKGAAPISGGPQLTIITADDKEVKGTLLDVHDGLLKIESQPPQMVDLLDVQKLTFGAVSGLSAKWVGQDQHDFVQVGSVQAANGIQDVHVHLLGLPTQKQIQQVRLILRSPPRVWLLDPTDSPNWRLFLDHSAKSPSADVYFEPPSADLFDRELQFTITYSDNSTDQLKVKSSTHTSDQAKVTSLVPAKAESQTFPVTIELGNDDALRGNLQQLTDDILTLVTPWQANVQVPLLQAQGLLMDHAAQEAKKLYKQRCAKPSSDDLAIVLAKDGKLAEIAGRIKQWEGHQLRFVYEGEEHAIPGDRLQALVFAAHPSAHVARTAQQVLVLTEGDTLSGLWQSLADGKVVLRMPWDAQWEIPIENISEIRTRNGNLVQLSDQQPVAVEQTPYFGRLLAYHRDETLDDAPLKMKGKIYSKGLAVHSRCLLSYALDGQFATFKTTVGFDEATGTHGNVVCRVLADGKELFNRPDLRGDQDPQTLELSVQGAKLLTLEIDFGENEDIHDRVIWAEPRLYRK
ncbi:MAG TPA: NPCBM/NEW2 domain-containing protein [Pirellulales bacterium]|jgi:hypothetical protein|nr:NPCBM/NEW2 domain-containing protein [Pirellulales bacterium]